MDTTDTRDVFSEEREELGEDVMDGYLRWIYSPKNELSDTKNCIIWQYKNYFKLDGVENKVSVGFGSVGGTFLK